MKKPLKVLCAVAALLVAFGLGWRVMPKVWPGIRAAVFRQPETTEPPEPDLYVPKSNASFNDPVSVKDSLIYYFYKDYCPFCKALEPLTAGLPKTVTLPDGTPSTVRLVCLNKVEEDQAKVISAYYEAHSVPEERQYVPALVIGDRYLFTGSEAVEQLMDALVAGEGLNTPLLNGAARISVESIN